MLQPLKSLWVRRLKLQPQCTKSYTIPEVSSTQHSMNQNKLEIYLGKGPEKESKVGWGHEGRYHGENQVPALWDG